jgi:hypothetical protein
MRKQSISLPLDFSRPQALETIAYLFANEYKIGQSKTDWRILL